MAEAKTFKLRILACNKLFYEGDAIEVIFPTTDGEWAVMANHAEMISTIEIGEMKVKLPDGSWMKAIVSDGFIDVHDNRVNIIVYSCEKPEEIDRFRAEAAMERAREQLSAKQSIREYHISTASLARAMARLKYSNKDI
ncbi:MAG: ATP synthase F1 subunit epsilon [Lachnospiraceae bacterium]|nr:ATP synthase F1 subunit epsilon [Lachnospiraceae bacterium]